jgi:2-oxoglutarate ferredoxin oxidoreductase subunit beta
MTGGQYSPTTPLDGMSTTTPYGNIDPEFDICNLAIGAGATFVARTTAFHTIEAQSIIKEAIQHKGVSVIEVVSTCPVIFGKMNRKGTPADMLKWMKDNSVTVAEAEKLSGDKAIATGFIPAQVNGKIIRGILKKVETPEYCDRYKAVCDKAQHKEEGTK